MNIFNIDFHEKKLIDDFFSINKELIEFYCNTLLTIFDIKKYDSLLLVGKSSNILKEMLNRNDYKLCLCSNFQEKDNEGKYDLYIDKQTFKFFTDKGTIVKDNITTKTIVLPDVFDNLIKIEPYFVKNLISNISNILYKNINVKDTKYKGSIYIMSKNIDENNYNEILTGPINEVNNKLSDPYIYSFEKALYGRLNVEHNIDNNLMYNKERGNYENIRVILLKY